MKDAEWGAVKKTSDGGFMVWVKYRARNSYGGYVPSMQMFYLNAGGNVVNVVDLSE